MSVTLEQVRLAWGDPGAYARLSGNGGWVCYVGSGAGHIGAPPFRAPTEEEALAAAFQAAPEEGRHFAERSAAAARDMLADACNGALDGPRDGLDLYQYAEHVRDRVISITSQIVELFGEDAECVAGAYGDAFDAIENAISRITEPGGSCCYEDCQDDAEVRLGKQLFCKYHAADGLLSGLPNGERDTIARFHAGLPVVGGKP